MVMTNSLKAVWPRIEEASKDNTLLPLIREWAEREGLTGVVTCNLWVGGLGSSLVLRDNDRATSLDLPEGFEAHARAIAFMYGLLKLAFNESPSQLVDKPKIDRGDANG